MTDPLDYTARIKAKGLDSTGVTEAHARTMSENLGGHTLLIVEVKHDRLIVNDDGTRQVQLGITRCEPVPAEQDDTVREFMRAIYRQRPEVAGQAVLQGTSGTEQSVEDAAAALTAATEDLQDASDGPADGEWDGDTEGPLPGPEPATCDFPGCILAPEHDGDHEFAGDGDAMNDEDPGDDGSVVQFSSRA